MSGGLVRPFEVVLSVLFCTFNNPLEGTGLICGVAVGFERVEDEIGFVE